MGPIIIFSVGILWGCGVARRGAGPGNPGNDAPTAMTVSKHDEMRASLMQAYRDWKGTPYVLGGASPEGVDCSSFVRIIFDRYFGIDVPTNTRGQMNAGTGVRRLAIRTGDLVFFQTGRRTLHVGILVNEKEFLHASTSQGVTLSSIQDNYWKSRYLAARRIF